MILGGAIESSMTVPGLTTKCENFLYKLTIENAAGTGKGSLTEMPLYNCTTNSKACTVAKSGRKNCRGHRNWPRSARPPTSSSKVSKSASSTAVKNACWAKPWSRSTGSAGG